MPGRAGLVSLAPRGAGPPCPDLRPYFGFAYEDFGRTPPRVDCYGLVRLPYLELLGIPLPLFDTVSPGDRADVDAAAALEAERPCWTEVAERAAWPLDVVVFHRPPRGLSGGRPLAVHVGVLAAAGRCLHIRAGGRSGVVPYADDPYLRPLGRRFFRHRARPSPRG